MIRTMNMWSKAIFVCSITSTTLARTPQIRADQASSLQPCGEAYYLPSQYTCYDSGFLCPLIDGIPTLRCGPDCYHPEDYSCKNDRLSSVPKSRGSEGNCSTPSTTLRLSSPPFDNYFYSDCNGASQVVITSPLPDSNLTIIGPRVLVAWPAGNSGIVVYFEPQNGVNGSLGIQLLNSSSSSPLSPIYDNTAGGNATVGVSTQLRFNSSATLSVAILGSIRTIRDFVEGPSILRPEIQDAIKYSKTGNVLELSRLWLDNITTTRFSFSSVDPTIDLQSNIAKFEAGTYTFNASFDYPQLEQLSANEVLSPESSALLSQFQQQATSLSFLSYTTKLTAGAWRFLTYFGRDSMIAALLLEPVLSVGEGGAIEAVISGVLERINSTDGSACHEETIGDYATWLNFQQNITSTAPLCDYKMIDTDFFLPVLVERHFVQNPSGSARASAFLSTVASTLPENSNLTYKELLKINADKIVGLATPFTASENQTIDNLIHLKQGEIVGQWRDSTYGIGGGRIPLDVNTALVPAALRSIAILSTTGILDFNAKLIDEYATIWEDSTLPFFEVHIPLDTAQARLENYTTSIAIPGLESQSSALNSDVSFHAVALEGNNNLSQVAVMNTDDCFRHFLLNTTNQPQLTHLLNATANNIQHTFPAGLLSDVGLFVANPAYGDSPVYAANFTRNAYHGTVVWSWQLAMMARGLELQLARCNSSDAPEFCAGGVYGNAKRAYNVLWDSIAENEEHLSTEVWSWTFDEETKKFEYADLGALPPPAGVSPTESDIVQLWSLTFLAVKRNEGLR